MEPCFPQGAGAGVGAEVGFGAGVVAVVGFVVAAVVLAPG